ncbi:hypothetical protein VNO77_28188 [Canavalia gladiata]|uniref:Uncharacterized protein n=1 Tax=Canavalia gladiata TaxID=3824 RepID=A0AAN9Q738_CANGL
MYGYYSSACDYAVGDFHVWLELASIENGFGTVLTNHLIMSLVRHFISVTKYVAALVVRHSLYDCFDSHHSETWFH